MFGALPLTHYLTRTNPLRMYVPCQNHSCFIFLDPKVLACTSHYSEQLYFFGMGWGIKLNPTKSACGLHGTKLGLSQWP